MSVCMCTSHVAKVFTHILGQQLCEMNIVAKKLSVEETK